MTPFNATFCSSFPPPLAPSPSPLLAPPPPPPVFVSLMDQERDGERAPLSGDAIAKIWSHHKKNMANMANMVNGPSLPDSVVVMLLPKMP